MSALSTVQIKEANAHLAALHHRVAELEGTVREQAESLIRKDEQCRAAVRELLAAKDREVSELRQRFARSEEEMMRLTASIQEQERELQRLRHHSRLLAQMCRSRPLLSALVSLMGEAEALPCLPETERCNGVPGDSSEDDLDDCDRTLLGTTV